MSGSLDRNRIMKLFEALSARLAARGIRGQLYIVGGSAMIVGYGRERTTRDVDARIEYAKDEVLAAAEEIAVEQSLDPNWLNENATLFMPPARDDSGTHRLQHARLGCDRRIGRAHAGDEDRRRQEQRRGRHRRTGGSVGNRERRSGIRDILNRAATHGRHRRAATGVRVEDRRREDEEPAVSESAAEVAHSEPPFRSCDSSPIHGGFDARQHPRFDTLSDTLRSGHGCDFWTRLDPEFANALRKTPIWTYVDAAGRPTM